MTDKALEGVRKPSVKFSRKLAKRIFGLYLQGNSILAIARMEGMPTANTIYEWKQREPWFRELMKSCKDQRADIFAEKAIEAAETALDKDDAPAARLRFDAYKWGAEVNDPSRFGKKVTHAGDKDSPIQFVVSTGFPAPNEHQRPPELGSDGLIKKSGAPAPLIEKEEVS